MSEAEKIAAGLSEAQMEDLTCNWDAACDCDWQCVTTDTADFWERQEEAGFAELVPVDEDALQDSFASERGIQLGGMMYRLTPLGLEVRTILERQSHD
jgi:hypothetical protein